MKRNFYFLTSLFLISGFSAIGKPLKNFDTTEATTRGSGLEAAKEFLKTMTVADGYEVTVFAAEPLLRNPSGIDIDERGRVWVTEIANYGSSRKQWGALDPKGDRVVILEDTNNDGVADKNTIYFQSRDIDSPYGVCVLGDKAYVSRSPEVLIFSDTDGDGKADKKEVLFNEIGGFDSDHCVHQFVFGPDGKIYFNFGNHAGQLKRPNGEFVVDVDGYTICVSGVKTPAGGKKIDEYRDGLVFRCNPDGSEVEVMGHNARNPYETCLDSFGTLFQSDNDDDGNKGTRINYVMDYGNLGFKDEITGGGWRESRTNIETDHQRRQWHQNDPGVIPNLLHTGAGAPCGMCVYESDLMPELNGALIHADASPREVRAYFLEPDGAGYSAKPKVILTSSDTWFRPCDVCVGPDGAIYVADWNDGMVGGHDLTDRVLEKMRGRIYRIAPKNFKSNIPKFDFASAAGCVEAMKNSNLATRARAWTKLHELGAVAENDLLRLWENDDARLRARSLQLLARIKGKEEKYLDAGCRDVSPDVRCVALRIAREIGVDTTRYVKMLVNDSSPQVRRDCTIALRRSNSSEAPKLWAQLAQQHDGKDRWYLEALGIGAAKRETEFFDAWRKLAGDKWNTSTGRDIIWRSRAPKAAFYLGKIIADKETLESERPRYFRALDFVKGHEKQEVLFELLTLTTAK